MGCINSNSPQAHSPCCHEGTVQCCPPGSWPALTLNYQPVGKNESISGVKAYHVGQGSRVLIIFEDIFGIDSGRHKIVCDTYASLGYNVYMPELLDKAYEGEVNPPKIIQFIKETLTVQGFTEKYGKLCEYLNQLGHKKCFAAGYCLGAWFAFRLSAKFDNLIAIASIHPSFQVENLYQGTEEGLISNCKCPSFFYVAGNDHENTKPNGSLTKLLLEKWKDKAGIFEFPKQYHGWVIRADPDNAQAKKDIETVFTMSHQYLSQFHIRSEGQLTNKIQVAEIDKNIYLQTQFKNQIYQFFLLKQQDNYSSLIALPIYSNIMYSWEDKIIDISNQNDHQLHHAHAKQVGSLTLSSPGRYHIILSRTSTHHSHQEMDQLIMEEYGLEELQPEQPQECPLPPLHNPGQDLEYIFAQCKIVLGGDISAFKAEKGIGDILGCRSVINDGNTLVYHFWDANFQYVLLQEIKY